MTLHAVEAAVQWVNLVFYLAPNAYVLSNPCKVQTPFILVCGFVRWTCWNTVSLKLCILSCIMQLYTVAAQQKQILVACLRTGLASKSITNLQVQYPVLAL